MWLGGVYWGSRPHYLHVYVYVFVFMHILHIYIFAPTVGVVGGGIVGLTPTLSAAGVTPGLSPSLVPGTSVYK